jgi:uncharacterized protein
MIHKFKFKDNYIVLDVNSGAVHLVDKVLYDVLEDYKILSIDDLLNAHVNQYKIEELKEAIAEIQRLEIDQMLFTKSIDYNYLEIENRKAVIKALCLHVAHDCNMRCQYCFADKGAFFGETSLMSFKTGKLAIDFLIKNSGDRRNLEVDFFGGEPLMNYEVVKQLVDYGKIEEKKYNKNIRFTITTNGLLLDDEKVNYFNQVMDNVILSIDGRPSINDNMRKTVNGKGTYYLIKDKYLNFVNKREGSYYMRGTFTKENLDFTSDVQHLIDEGFDNISIEPVVLPEKENIALKDEDLNKIFLEYDKLADLYLESIKEGKPFDFFHFNIDLNQGPCIIKRLSGCGAGTEYIAISPEGDIFPCHQFVGKNEYCLGNLYQDKFVNHLYHEFNSAHILNKPTCLDCWAKFYCSGGCHANALNFNGDIKKPYLLGCEMEKKRVECAIGIKAELIKSTNN